MTNALRVASSATALFAFLVVASANVQAEAVGPFKAARKVELRSLPHPDSEPLPAVARKPRKLPPLPVPVAIQSARVDKSIRANFVAPPSPFDNSTRASVAVSYQTNQSSNPNLPVNPAMAVGRNYVVHSILNSVQVYNKSGTHVQTASAASFWGTNELNLNSQAIYDASADRFVLSEERGNTDPHPYTGLAISDGSDPTGTWTFFNFLGCANMNDWANRPLIATNQNWLLVLNTCYTTMNTAYTYLFVFDKASAYSGTLVGHAFTQSNVYYTPVMSNNNAADAYLLASQANAMGNYNLVIGRITLSGGIPAVDWTWQTVGVNIGGAIANGYWIPMGPQNGCTYCLNLAGDARILQAHEDVWADGRRHVHAAFTFPTSNSTGYTSGSSVINYFEYNIDTGNAQSSYGYASTNGTASYHYPTMAHMESGGVDYSLVTLSYQTNAAYPYAAFWVWNWSTMSYGSTFYTQSTANEGTTSWGHYTQTAIDPTSSTTLWGSAPYTAGTAFTQFGTISKINMP